MKRITLLSSVIVSSALAVCAIAAASASATVEPLGVFCKSAPASHECGGSAYPAGTEIKSSLSTPLLFKTGGGTTVFQCTESAFNMAVTESLSAPMPTALTFGGCNTQFTVNRLSQETLRWTEGTHNGKLFGTSEMWIKFLGLKCYFTFYGPLKVIGGTSPTIEASGVAAGLSGGLCPSSVNMSGTYTISTPTPLYVEKP
jgi:hypothetical protein